MTREDFLAHVIFNDDFVDGTCEGVGAREIIEKAMLAHHAAKKAKIARKYRALYGANTAASLGDNLGDLGIFYNETAHHKGHKVSGISTALRVLTAIDVRTGRNSWRVEGLTDFRVTRVSNLPEHRFTVSQLPLCSAYGEWVRAVLEESFSRGVILPVLARTSMEPRSVASRDAFAR
jgi:hypothetical protein